MDIQRCGAVTVLNGNVYQRCFLIFNIKETNVSK